MKDPFMLFPITLIAFVVIMFSFIIVNIFSPTEYELNAKLDRCIKLANEIGLDPNDEKPDYIKKCYEE